MNAEALQALRDSADAAGVTFMSPGFSAAQVRRMYVVSPLLGEYSLRSTGIEGLTNDTIVPSSSSYARAYAVMRIAVEFPSARGNKHADTLVVGELTSLLVNTDKILNEANARRKLIRVVLAYLSLPEAANPPAGFNLELGQAVVGQQWPSPFEQRVQFLTAVFPRAAAARGAQPDEAGAAPRPAAQPAQPAQEPFEIPAVNDATAYRVDDPLLVLCWNIVRFLGAGHAATYPHYWEGVMVHAFLGGPNTGGGPPPGGPHGGGGGGGTTPKDDPKKPKKPPDGKPDKTDSGVTKPTCTTTITAPVTGLQQIVTAEIHEERPRVSAQITPKLETNAESTITIAAQDTITIIEDDTASILRRIKNNLRLFESRNIAHRCGSLDELSNMSDSYDPVLHSGSTPNISLCIATDPDSGNIIHDVFSSDDNLLFQDAEPNPQIGNTEADVTMVQHSDIETKPEDPRAKVGLLKPAKFDPSKQQPGKTRGTARPSTSSTSKSESVSAADD
ncbi:hypothetical protein GE061_007774 [Apolygus lucorum]|uniref:Uncharacterized protein n=1 Tax=Apolygus lucorum TaxID=248454 RepID=A0A6A4IZZ7_APOLU|nr:hypothetical protein GE061_007774 [Apolygus lucorum]